MNYRISCICGAEYMTQLVRGGRNCRCEACGGRMLIPPIKIINYYAAIQAEKQKTPARRCGPWNFSSLLSPS